MLIHMTESYFVIKKNEICRKIGTIGNHHGKKNKPDSERHVL